MAEETPGASGPPSGRPRRRLRDSIKLPAVSGWATALLLFNSFAVSALAIPMTLRLPRWVAAEIVLAVWWLIWVAALARLLYTRSVIRPDIQGPRPRGPFGYGAYSGEGAAGCDPGCMPTGGDEGCLIALLLAVLLPGIVWLVIEVAIPFLALVIFGTIRGMLAHVVNDRHNCQHHLGRSLGWATLWATIYTAPLALLVWWIHHLAVRHPAEQQAVLF
jgi:hypothetical protein